MRKVSLERYYFLLYNGALTLRRSKMVLNLFCDNTLHILSHLIFFFFFFEKMYLFNKLNSPEKQWHLNVCKVDTNPFKIIIQL